jgi:hypothetical protein
MTSCLHLHDLNFVVSLLGKKECEMCLHESWRLKHMVPKRFGVFSSLYFTSWCSQLDFLLFVGWL